MTAEHSLYPWLTGYWQRLSRLQQQGRLPHALLLAGMSGIGKSQLAQRLAEQMLCAEATDEPCGQCKSCLLNAQGTHPDLMLVAPDEPGKQIRVDQIRELGDFINAHAQQGGYRVVIINPPEAMNIAASNALLKGLEEPGERTLFILISDHPSRLLPTIRSRCQTINLAEPDPALSVEWLQAQQIENADSLLRLCGGAPVRAKDLADSDIFERRQQLFQGLKAVVGGKSSVPDTAQQWVKADLLQLLEWFHGLLADMIRYNQLSGSAKIVNEDAEKLIIRAAEKLPTPVLFAFADKIQEHRQQLIAKNNPNQQLLCEDLLVAWISLFRH